MGYYGAAVAERSQIFGGIEAEARNVPESADAPSADRGAVGLGAIFDEKQGMATANIADGGDIAGMAIEMDTHNSPGSPAARLDGDNGLFQLAGIDGVCRGIDIDQ